MGRNAVKVWWSDDQTSNRSHSHEVRSPYGACQNSFAGRSMRSRLRFEDFLHDFLRVDSLYIRFSVSPRCAHIPHVKRMHQACLNLATCSVGCPGSWVFVWWFFLRFRSGSGFGTGATWCHMVLHAATELFDVTVISRYSTDVFNWYKYDISMLWLYVCIVWFNITNWSPPRCSDDHWRFEKGQLFSGHRHRWQRSCARSVE